MKLELAPLATVAGRLASLKDAPQAGLPSTGITGVSCCAPVLYVGAGDGPRNMYKGNFKVWDLPSPTWFILEPSSLSPANVWESSGGLMGRQWA